MTRRGVEGAFSQFPETSLSILKEFAGDTALPRAMGEPEVQPRERMGELFDALRPDQIGKIFGHSEQPMARAFEDIVMPSLAERHTPLSKDDPSSGIQEVLVLAASLQDCCWWCQRRLAALSGSKQLPGLDESVNVRLVISSGKSFPGIYFPNPMASLERPESRAHITDPVAINLAEVPFAFHYGELPERYSHHGGVRK